MRLKNLSKKALRGVIELQLFLAIVLFLSAWSFHYWAAWAYFILSSVFALSTTIYFLMHDPSLIERRMKAGPGAERERIQKIIQAMAGALSFAIFVVAGLDHRFHWSSVPTLVALVAFGIVLSGMCVVFGVFKENSFAASSIQVEANQRVVSTGPYAWVRHPMYTGSALALLATPVALGSLWALLPAILLCGVIVVRLLNEERYLAVNLSGYAEYCRKVPYRLIPLVW